MDTKKRFNNATDKMRGKIKSLKTTHIKAFSAMKNQFPGIASGLTTLLNPYALAAAAVFALGVMAVGATKKAAAFNHEFLQIEQLNLEKPTKDMALYKDTVRDTAFTLGTDLNKTTQAFYDVQSATGLFGNEAKSVVEQVGKFSIATGADLNDSINATTKSMKAFGLGTQDITGLLESNAKTVQTGIVSFSELAKVQTEYAGAGQSVDTANKLFAVFTSIAGGAAQGANMTKTAFQGLTQASTIKGLESIGISMYDSNGQMRDLSKVVEEVATKFKKMNPKEIDVLINKIGGPEGLRNMFTKLKTGSEDFFKTMEAFDSSQFDLDKALKNAQGDVTVLGSMVKNRWNVIMEQLGQKILPIVATVLNVINNALIWARNNWENIKRAVEVVMLPLSFMLSVTQKIFKHWESIKSAFSSGGIISGLKRIGIVLLDSLLSPLQSLLDLGKSFGIDIAGSWSSDLEELRKKLGLIEEEQVNNDTPLIEGAGLTPDATIDGNGAGGGSGAADKVTKVVGAGQQVKNITINIDSLNKGGINTKNTTLASMSAKEIEQWFNEAMLRMVRNVEMSI